MRLIPLVPAVFVLVVSGPAFAQEWTEYVSREDFFSVNFPGQPEVRDITYATEYITLPGRVHSRQDGPNRYSVTVIDYSTAQQIHTERSKRCTGYPDTCGNRWMVELRGAMDYAASKFILKRDARVTLYAYYWSDLVEGRRLQPHQRRWFEYIRCDSSARKPPVYPRGHRIAELPPPALFQQSLGFIDKEEESSRTKPSTTTHTHHLPARGDNASMFCPTKERGVEATLGPSDDGRGDRDGDPAAHRGRGRRTSPLFARRSERAGRKELGARTRETCPIRPTANEGWQTRSDWTLGGHSRRRRRRGARLRRYQLTARGKLRF